LPMHVTWMATFECLFEIAPPPAAINFVDS
jgi:hypothetical protein